MDIGSVVKLESGSWGVVTGSFALSGALFLICYCAEVGANTIVELR